MSSRANSTLKSGEEFPYDGDEAGPSKDWAQYAARGVLADLTDRRGIRHAFDEIDEDIRVEIVESLADIIRTAAPKPEKIA